MIVGQRNWCHGEAPMRKGCRRVMRRRRAQSTAGEERQTQHSQRQAEKNRKEGIQTQAKKPQKKSGANNRKEEHGKLTATHENLTPYTRPSDGVILDMYLNSANNMGSELLGLGALDSHQLTEIGHPWRCLREKSTGQLIDKVEDVSVVACRHLLITQGRSSRWPTSRSILKSI